MGTNPNSFDRKRRGHVQGLLSVDREQRNVRFV